MKSSASELGLRVIDSIWKSKYGRIDRPGLDDDNATSLKHGKEAFLDYMLDSAFMGSK